MKCYSCGLNDFSQTHGLSMVGRWWLAVMLLALAFAQMWFGRCVCVLWNSVQFLSWCGGAVLLCAWPRWLSAAWGWWLLSRASDLHRWCRWGWHWNVLPTKAEAAISYIQFKVPLTGVIWEAFWWTWPAGCGTVIFLCATSPEAWSSPCLPSFLSPRLSSSSPAPDGQHSGEDTGKSRCVYLPETKCCAVADGSALEQAAHSDTTVTLQWSLYWRENSFSLNIALNDLFVGFGTWCYKPRRQNFFPVNFVTFSS